MDCVSPRANLSLNPGIEIALQSLICPIRGLPLPLNQQSVDMGEKSTSFFWQNIGVVGKSKLEVKIVQVSFLWKMTEETSARNRVLLSRLECHPGKCCKKRGEGTNVSNPGLTWAFARWKHSTDWHNVGTKPLCSIAKHESIIFSAVPFISPTSRTLLYQASKPQTPLLSQGEWPSETGFPHSHLLWLSSLIHLVLLIGVQLHQLWCSLGDSSPSRATRCTKLDLDWGNITLGDVLFIQYMGFVRTFRRLLIPAAAAPSPHSLLLCRVSQSSGTPFQRTKGSAAEAGSLQNWHSHPCLNRSVFCSHQRTLGCQSTNAQSVQAPWQYSSLKI